MATTRPFAYNTGSTIDGTTQIGNIAIGVSDQDYSQNPGGVKWWMGPDEDLGYIIAHEVPTGDQPTPVEVDASISFWRSTSLTDQSFLDLLNILPITIGLSLFTNVSDALTWLTNNNYFTSYDSNLPTPTPAPTSAPTSTPLPATSTPTPTPTATEVPPIETPTPTSIPTYYYYYLLNCNLVDNKYGRSTNPSLSGDTFNVDTNTCYTIVGNDPGTSYDYDLDIATLITDCTDVLCGLPTPTPTPAATSSPTSTPTATPEMASLDIDIVMGYNGISFGGVTYTSDTTINVIKNQQYNIIAFNGSGLFQNWEGTNVNLPVPNSSNTIVTITGDTATLKAVFPEMTPTPAPTTAPTSTPLPATSTPTPTPTTVGSCSGVPYNLTNIFAPPTSGNAMWISNATPPNVSNLVNTLAIANPAYFNEIDNDGTDRTSYFNNFTGSTFTMTVCQNGNSATYTGISGAIAYDNGTNSFIIDGVKLSLVQSSPVSAFTFNELVYIDLSNGSQPTATPVPTDVPTETPTPTPTATEVPATNTPTPTPLVATSTPTPTPTPTEGGSGVGSWYFYSDASGAFDAAPPISDGNAVFTINAASTSETFNPNKIDGVSYLYFNISDSLGTDYTSQFGGYTGGTGTITISQNGDTATYTSTTSGSFSIENLGGGFFFKIDTSLCTQTKTSNAPYVYADPISIVFNSLSSTPTPTPGGPTATPTPTPTPTSTGGGAWYFYYTEGGFSGPPFSQGNALFMTNANNSTYNPNFSEGTSQIYLNRYDSNGTDYSTQFNNLMIAGGSITITQNGQTATYTGVPYQFQYNDSNGFLYISNNVSQTVYTASTFTYTDPISITFGS